MEKMPNIAQTPRTAPPTHEATPPPPAPTRGVLRRTLLIFLLVVIAGVVPMVLIGELLGWWVLARSAPPFLVPPTATRGLP